MESSIDDEIFSDRHSAPDDTLLYAVFPAFALEQHTPDELQSKLKELNLQILDFTSDFVKDYIWQHQSFDLKPCCPSASASSSTCLCLASSSSFSSSASAKSSVAHLHGSLRYGDNLEDEWFAVFLLFEISRRFPDVSVRVWDSDGEFLLIEAAFAIPRWLKPENSSNRVFISRGELHIVPLPSNPSQVFTLPPKPSLQDALRVLADDSINTRAQDSVQTCIARRIEGYPEKAKKNMHRCRVRVPLSVAQVLKHEPHLISLAVEAFYDRDVDSMKSAMKMEKFLENKEMVDVSARMSRAMYAQLVQQIFQAPRCYPMPSASSSNFKEADLGMKIACGFEMMYQQRKQYEVPIDTNAESNPGEISKFKAVRNNDAGWEAFKKALYNRGYFRGLLEGSIEYRRLMDEALEYYRNTTLSSKVSQVLDYPVKRIDEVLALPYSPTDFDSNTLPPNDDESWLYNGEGDLNAAILERQKEIEAYERKRSKRKQSKRVGGASSTSATMVDEGDDFDPESVARNMHAFVEKMSSYEGAEVPGERDLEAVSLDMKQFLKELKIATEINIDDNNTTLLEESVENDDYSSSDMDYDEDGSMSSSQNGETETDDMDMSGERNEAVSENFMRAYSDALNDQLKNSTLAKTFVHAQEATSSGSKATPEISEKAEELSPIDVDFNLVQSLLDSFSSQQGLAGPASNLLGLMGLQLPDESKRKHDS